MLSKKKLLAAVRYKSLIGLSVVLAMGSQNAFSSCTYNVESQWSTGFVANITIKNDTGAALNGWNVSWQYASNRVSGGWNANISGSNPYSASNLSWNGSIPAGQSVTFGFQGTSNGSPEKPSVSGAACNGGSTSSVSSSASSSSTSSSSIPSSSSSSSTSSAQSTLVIQEQQSGFCRVDGSIDSDNGGFTGAGFANTNNVQGAAVVWAVQASTSSRHRLTVRFANGGSSNRNGTLLINGGANGSYTLALPSTGSWTSWQTASIDVDLVQGNNILQLSASGAEGLPNMDSLSVIGATTTAGNCSGTNSSSSNSSSSSSSSSSSMTTKKFVGNITTSGAVRSDFARYWNQITPENEGKWGSVERSRDVYDWSGLDRAYNYAVQNNIPFKQHTFVWGSQFPSWINSLSAADQAAEIEEWIRDYCARYPKTAMIDVVNEATPGHAPAAYAQNAFGNNWIIRSFQLARQYCPNAILILNDYNVLSWNTNEFIAMARPAINAGVVDAIGLQAHGLADRPFSDVQSKLNQIAALGLPIYISEYDIEKTNDQEQLQVMQAQFPLFYNHPSVVGITIWGYVVGATWRDGTGLITSSGTPRPAMTWLMNYLGR